MGKRFGRKKKRKLLERIETLRIHSNNLKSKIAESAGYKEMYMELVNSVERAFGANSVLLPPRVTYASYVYGRETQLPELKRNSSWETVLEVNYRLLEKCEIAIETDFVDFSKKHICVSLPGDGIHYYLDSTLFDRYGIAIMPEVEKQLVLMLRRQIVKELTKGRAYEV